MKTLTIIALYIVSNFGAFAQWSNIKVDMDINMTIYKANEKIEEIDQVNSTEVGPTPFLVCYNNFNIKDNVFKFSLGLYCDLRKKKSQILYREYHFKVIFYI
jgi:hypothetical protein